MNTIITTTTNNALVARHITAIAARTGSALMGTAKALLIEEAKRQMRSTSGAHIVYRKADGSVREAFATLNPVLCGKHIPNFSKRNVLRFCHICTPVVDCEWFQSTALTRCSGRETTVLGLLPTMTLTS